MTLKDCPTMLVLAHMIELSRFIVKITRQVCVMGSPAVQEERQRSHDEHLPNYIMTPRRQTDLLNGIDKGAGGVRADIC